MLIEGTGRAIVLEADVEAGYARIDKAFEGRRPRTWVSATKAVRTAFAADLAGAERTTYGDGHG